MVEDIFNSVKAHLYDRATSPLMGSIVVSWLAWNYRLPLLLMSDLTFHQQIQYIEIVLYSNTWEILGPGILYPLLTAGFYIFLYPYPAEFVFKYARNKQKKILKIKHEIDDDSSMSKKQARQHRISLREAENALQEIIESTGVEKSDLKEELRVEKEKTAELSTSASAELKASMAEALEYKKEIDKIRSQLTELDGEYIVYKKQFEEQKDNCENLEDQLREKDNQLYQLEINTQDQLKKDFNSGTILLNSDEITIFKIIEHKGQATLDDIDKEILGSPDELEKIIKSLSSKDLISDISGVYVLTATGQAYLKSKTSIDAAKAASLLLGSQQKTSLVTPENYSAPDIAKLKVIQELFDLNDLEARAVKEIADRNSTAITVIELEDLMINSFGFNPADVSRQLHELIHVDILNSEVVIKEGGNYNIIKLSERTTKSLFKTGMFKKIT